MSLHPNHEEAMTTLTRANLERVVKHFEKEAEEIDTLLPRIGAKKMPEYGEALCQVRIAMDSYARAIARGMGKYNEEK